jgi:hypothetical protein
MSMIDSKLLLSDAQALTATADSTNSVDFSSDRDIGRGEAWAMVMVVDVAADFTTGDETYTFAIETDDNSSFSSATTLFSTAILAASLTAGSQHVFPLGITNERYVQAVYTLAGTSPSATVTTYLAPLNSVNTSSGVYYASGYTV